MTLIESLKETWSTKRLYFYIILAHLLCGCQQNLYNFLLHKDIQQIWDDRDESFLEGGTYIFASILALVLSCVIGAAGVPKLGCKRLLLVGTATSSLGSISLAFQQLAANNSGKFAFMLTCFLGQFLSLLGTILIYAANLLYIAILFPKSISFTVGILETVSSFGEIIGISLGSLLRDAGGLMLPFLLFGTLLLLIFGLIYLQLPEHYGENRATDVPVLTPVPGVDISGKLILKFWHLFKIPPAFLMVSVMIILGITWNYLLTSFDLQVQGPPHNLEDDTILLFHALSSLTYVIVCPALGYYASKLRNSRRWIIVVEGLFLDGLVLSVIGILLLHDLVVGCCVYVAETLAYIICILVLTIAFSASYVPIFETCIVYLRHWKYSNNIQTYGTISLWISIALAFGSFVGGIGGFLPLLKLTNYSILLLIYGCLVIIWGLVIFVIFGGRLQCGRSKPKDNARTSGRSNTIAIRERVREYHEFFTGVRLTLDETVDSVEPIE